jgi:hypothetical protein
MDFFHEYGGDPLKPSLFELVAQEQLRDLLQPALKYVLSVSPTSDNRHPTVYSILIGYLYRFLHRDIRGICYG